MNFLLCYGKGDVYGERPVPKSLGDQTYALTNAAYVFRRITADAEEGLICTPYAPLLMRLVGVAEVH